MRIFVTGATGYIGGALVRRLAAAGHEVRALVRPTSSEGALRQLGELGVATFVGDLADRYSLREGMSGADWVIHAAAELDFAAPAARMQSVNVQGTENVASLAYKLGVGRLLVLSSIAAFGGSPEDGTPATEETPPRQPFPSQYSASKHGADQAVAAWERRKLKVNTVYPSLVYGPPGKKSGSNAVIGNFLRGRIPVLVAADKPTSWIYIDDLVAGIERVMDRGPAGRKYLLAGEIATPRQLAGKIHRLGGARPPRIELPLGLVRGLVPLAQPLYRLAGRSAPFTADQLRSLTRPWAFDDRRAREELGWQPRGLDAGLPPTIESLQQR